MKASFDKELKKQEKMAQERILNKSKSSRPKLSFALKNSQM